MKTHYAFLFILLLSCNRANLNCERTVVEETTSKNYVDSFHNALLSRVEFDTVGVEQAPVRIAGYHLVQKKGTHYKSVALTYKNISAKKIEAIRFKWYGTDSTGAPVEMGYAATGIGGSFDDEPLEAGKERTATWGVLTNKLDTITKAWPTEVVFEDGSKWESKTN
ncbi:hypothetical protein [Taibaiella soli]|uniref:Uncharacterized protein n=1 Tax=Taibaiella soli TaxID=1649169 RepID=A0A2W2ADM8_9BACT|nr:hypothetical protein [Taibaiella soli]PZF71702.1 hypothetical protein DN068_16670 [Taibaiella soli]